MSLLEAAERFASIDRSAVTLDTARCLHTQDRYSSCESCFGVCPVQAIKSGKPPTLASEKCQSCLACLTVCPVGAYSADDAVTSLLNSITHLEGNALELVCAKNPQPEKGNAENTGIRVRGCLAGLGAGAYLALSAFGLERIIARTEACSACEWSTLRSEIETQITRAKHILSAWGKDEILINVSTDDEMVERPLWSAENPPLSRRDLFRMMARQGQVAIARAMENGQVHGDRRPGRDRLRMLGAMAHLPVPELDVNLNLGNLNFAFVSITEECTACGACGRGCPTGALKFEKNQDETTYALKFSARNCIGCDLCMHVCVPSAVTVNQTPTFKQVFGEETMMLQEGGLVKCERCGVLIAKQDDRRLCTLCEYRRTHPFGSMLPPGFKRNSPTASEEKR